MTSPEEAAAALLARAWAADQRLPIDVKWIAEEHERLDVRSGRDLRLVPGAPDVRPGNRLSGLLVPNERRIWVDEQEAEDSEGRKRFTIAHELGHWVLHVDTQACQLPIYCRADQLDAPDAPDEPENEANRFAAELLMPARLVRDEVGDGGDIDLFALRQRFGVGSTAITLRLEQLGLLPDYLKPKNLSGASGNTASNQTGGNTEMGIYDSSKTRVQPVFDQLRAADGTGRSWLSRLLTLPRREDGFVWSQESEQLGPLLVAEWCPREHQLQPPKALLRWLIEHPRRDPPESLGGPVSAQQRQRLLQGDPAARERALALLDQKQTGKEWHIFEGATSVDAYLETAELIVLIEGKRTEPGPTTHTTWMPCRDQMLRNLDDAWDERGSRQLVAFYIVEGQQPSGAAVAVPPNWQKAVTETVSASVLEASLPHRTPEERSAIANVFLGATTWQAVCAALEIDFASLPNLVSS